VSVTAGFYPDTLGFGGIAGIKREVGCLGAVPPAGSRGRAPGLGSGAKAPRG